MTDGVLPSMADGHLFQNTDRRRHRMSNATDALWDISRKLGSFKDRQIVRTAADDLDTLRADLAAAQAVIEQALTLAEKLDTDNIGYIKLKPEGEWYARKMLINPRVEALCDFLEEALAQPPADALAAHDAQVAAKALDDAAADMEARFSERLTLGKPTSEWLTDRAKALRDGQGEQAGDNG